MEIPDRFLCIGYVSRHVQSFKGCGKNLLKLKPFKDKTLTRISVLQHIHHKIPEREREGRVAYHHSAFMGNCPTVSHTILAGGGDGGRWHITIQFLWATALLLVTRYQPYLPSGRVFLQGSKNVGSVQNFILLFCVWCESRELGSRGNSRFLCVTPVAETFSDRVAFRMPPNISDAAPLQKQPTVLTLQSLLFFSVYESFLCFRLSDIQ